MAAEASKAEPSKPAKGDKNERETQGDKGGGDAKAMKGGFTYKETYDLYNQQLHYANNHYTTPQLNAWQTEWNKYFTKHNMEIPMYAHKVVKPGKGKKERHTAMEV